MAAGIPRGAAELVDAAESLALEEATYASEKLARQAHEGQRWSGLRTQEAAATVARLLDDPPRTDRVIVLLSNYPDYPLKMSSEQVRASLTELMKLDGDTVTVVRRDDALSVDLETESGPDSYEVYCWPLPERDR